MAETRQRGYAACDYGFSWVDDGTQYGWYEWDQKAGELAARKARDAEARRLRAEGWSVRVSVTDGIISKGGVGSGHPHIELWTKFYRFDAVR